jgi:serine/threonine-protein kinase
MALNPADIAIVSRLLDEALALPEAERAAWLAGLAPEHQAHAQTLRDMLAQESALAADARLSTLPRLGDDGTVAQAGDLVGPYRVLREIGHGGMGSVWLAERADGSYKRQVAIKLPRLAWGAGLAERMRRERDIGALLEHPNIARLYDAGVDERGRPYLALEYVDGQPIDAWCEAQALGVRQRLRLFVQVARAVAYAHGRLVVHRDLKPSNVLVTADGQVHLLDFGIAKFLHEAGADEPGLTQQQERVMTPHYASPEQVAGGAITVASDVYSLGVLAYELLTGTLPIAPKRSTLGAVEEAILQGEAPPASRRVHDRDTAKALRGEVDAILAKAMQREPAQRYATADALAQDIERYLQGETVSARPDSLAYRLGKALKRHRLAFTAGGAVAVAVLSGAGVSLVQAQRANEEAARARIVKEFVVDVFRVNSRGSPANKGLRQLPAELLVEHGAKLIETKFAGQPRLRAELFGVVAGIFADIGAYRLAADYAARQVDLLATLGASRSERALGTLLLGEVLFTDLRLNEANEQARQALALAEGDAALQPRALLLLARVLRRQGRQDEGRAVVAQAEQAMQGRPGPQVVRAHLKAIRAAYFSNDNQFDKAMPLYDEAIAEALAAEGPLSPAAVDIRLIVGREMAAHSRGADGERYRQAALQALRDGGGAADVRAALEEADQVGRLFQMDQMSAGEATAALRRAQAMLAMHGALVPEAIKASVDFNLGKISVVTGDLKTADALLTSSVASLRVRSEGPSERFQQAAFLGLLAMYAGRHDEAQRVQREAIEARKELSTAKHMFAIQDYTNAALNLVMQERYAQATAVLDAAPAVPPGAQGAAAEQYALLVPRLRARLKLAEGDAAAAWQLLPPEKMDDWPPLFPYDDVLLRGEVLCALGRRAEGLPLLEKSLAWHPAKVHQNHPELARARAVAGACAWAQGHPVRARELAALAHAAVTAQPDVSPYFKRPVQRLDALVAVRTASR